MTPVAQCCAVNWSHNCILAIAANTTHCLAINMALVNYIAFGVGLLFVASSVLKLLHLPDVETSQFMVRYS